MRPDLDPEIVQRLHKLPEVAAPPYGFGEFSRRHARRRARAAQAPLRLMAAAVAVVLAGWGMKHGLLPALMSGATRVPDPAVARWSPRTAPEPLPVSSASAERWLNQQPRSAIVRVPTQMAVTELEDQIAAMDDQLNAERLSQRPAQQLLALQRDRAQLVESLAQVRYAQILVAEAQ